MSASKHIIRVDRIASGVVGWECDGVVWYEIRCPDGEYHFMIQPFRKGPAGDMKIPNEGKKHCWGWDGVDHENPTLVPSYLCVTGCKHLPGMGLRVHLYLVQGKIQLCGDSIVVTE